KEKTIVPARISVSPESVTFTSKSESKQLQVLVWDTEGKEIENADITYHSASESVALVSDKGLLTAVGKGDTTIRVSCGNISVTVAVKVNIKSEEPEEESGIGVEGLEDKYVYTGAKIEPSFIVKDYDRSVTLVKNVDYTVKYYNNQRIGTATFLVNGKGNYSGKLFEGSFEIVSVQKDIDPEEIESLANLKGVKIKKPEAVTYTGEELYPESLQLTFNKKNSITYYLNDEGTYETENGDTIPAIVAISNNVNKGTASILLAGSDNTSVKSTFKINPVDLSKAAEGDLNIEVEEGIYAVKGAVPVVTVTYKGQELAEGLDYSIKYSYNNNKNVGNAAGKVLITGKGNFSKKAKAVDFDINAFEIDENSVNAVNAYMGIKAGAIKICMLDQNGTLIPAKQFEVKVSDDAGNELESKDKLEEGSYTLTVLPKSDNLSGRATLDINVTENNIAKTSINGYIIKSYTGEAITLDGDDFSEIAILNKNKVELIYGEDYEVAGYINNVNKGTMRVIIKGINDYCGIKEIKVKINAKE
nr:Ig-like domain-containing protein [Lachnospiraceae bacterium]